MRVDGILVRSFLIADYLFDRLVAGGPVVTLKAILQTRATAIYLREVAAPPGASHLAAQSLPAWAHEPGVGGSDRRRG